MRRGGGPRTISVMTGPTTQLLLYRFGPGARFEGQLVGALERMESGGAVRILDTFFVTRDADSGEVAAINRRGDGAGGIVAPLLDFRLDQRARRRATRKALDDSTPGIPSETLRDLFESLPPGSAIAAVLVEHVWAQALADAVARVGGSAVSSEDVDATTLAEIAPHLLGLAEGGPTR
jgi:hypothetical protein